MLRDVYLHGALGKTYGRRFRLDVESPAEAIRALGTLRPKLKREIAAGSWRVVVGPPHVRYAIDVELITMKLGSQPLHLVPANGAAGGDVGKAVVGVVLIGAAFVLTAGAAAGLAAPAIGALGITGTQMAVMGGAMVLGGVAGMLTAPPGPGAQPTQTMATRPDDVPSFIFSGVTNNTQEGGPVPMIYGRHLVGTVLVNAGITVEGS